MNDKTVYDMATRIESKSLGLKKELFNLNEMILNATADCKNQIAKENEDNNPKLQLADTREDIFLETDKGRINQVVSNLLSDAIKFTKAGSIHVATEKKVSEVVVTIKDSGTGIDPKILPRLFTKFATKSTSGTGLGLFISKSIIEAHGGKIWAENNADGKGATFYFTLHHILQNCSLCCTALSNSTPLILVSIITLTLSVFS